MAIGTYIYHTVSQFSYSVVSDSLQPHDCSMPGFPVHYQLLKSPISSSVIPFSSCLQSFPVSGSFPVSQFFTSGGRSIGISASTSVLPTNIQDSFISFGVHQLDLLAVQGTLKSLLQHHSSKASILRCSVFFIVQLSYPYMDVKNWKNHSFD